MFADKAINGWKETFMTKKLCRWTTKKMIEIIMSKIYFSFIIHFLPSRLPVLENQNETSKENMIF